MDLENLSTDEQMFADALAADGVPVTAAEIEAELQTLADAAGLTIANPSAFSAFWCFCRAAIVAPALWLVAYLVKVALPMGYVQTASGAWLDLLATGYDLDRKNATCAVGNLLFSRAATAAALTIPAGTVVRTTAINGTIHRMATTAEAIMDVGEDSASVACIATEAGSAANLGTGYYSILETVLPETLTVTNEADWLTTPGADEETDDELRLRMRNQFAAVGDWHTDAKYKAMLAEYAPIAIDRIYIDHGDVTGPRGAGTADIYLLFDAATDPTEFLARLNTYVTTDGNHGHGDDVQVLALPELAVGFSLGMYFFPTVTTVRRAEILAGAEQVLRCMFRENDDYPAVMQVQVSPNINISVSVMSAIIHNEFPGEISRINFVGGNFTVGLQIPRLVTLALAELV